MDSLTLTNEERSCLLELADASIRFGVKAKKAMSIAAADYSAALQKKGATFVTLKRDGVLRGCIGMIEAVRPLCVDVVENAFAAAFRDRRFPPVREEELQLITPSISVLSPREELPCRDEAHLLEMLQPGLDGLTIQDGPYIATFLPIMWERFITAEEFLGQLKLKAGLHPKHWSASMYVTRFRAFHF